jgi:hypothetical protein
MALFLLCPNLGWIQGQFNFTELSLRYRWRGVCPVNTLRKWVFQAKESKLFELSKVKIRRHSCPKLNGNSYLNWKYFLERKERMKRQTPWVQTGLSYFV